MVLVYPKVKKWQCIIEQDDYMIVKFVRIQTRTWALSFLLINNEHLLSELILETSVGDEQTNHYWREHMTDSEERPLDAQTHWVPYYKTKPKFYPKKHTTTIRSFSLVEHPSYCFWLKGAQPLFKDILL